MHFQYTILTAPSKKLLLTLGALGALVAGCAMPAGDTEPADDTELVGTSEEAISMAVWKGDVQVKIIAEKDVLAQKIRYTITAKNLGDDDARDVIISHTPSYFDGLNGMSFDSVTASRATCTGVPLNNAVLSMTCSPITLGVGATETVKVVVSNPGNLARTGTAQAMGITPDPVPSNNYASIDVP
jgi:uncharacterized repeat protein (TIGR01451 family)